MIWYFWEIFCPLVRVKMEQQGQEFNTFKKLVKKAINAKAKAAFQPCFYICKTDQHCLRDSWPSAAKVSTQNQLMKDPKVEKPKSKPKELKALAPQCSNSVETSDKAQKKKKKNDCQNKRDCRIRKGSIPATGVNSTDANNSKKKKCL